jgi:hypothetical protein
MRKIVRILKYILMPWKKSTNAIWYQVRQHQRRINGITFKLNELELCLESDRAKALSKPKRGRPRKQPSKPLTRKGA